MGFHTRETIRALVRNVIEQERPLIVQLGDPVLRNPAAPFDGQLNDSELAELLVTMRKAMHDAPA